ncbi:TIM barrel protein [Halobacillus locisalis]|uniref:TIM barrel protein n=1 Tax=Halobacillus locisalis TaxID=220753 RepID=A0A838CN88_9BACI|nr:TIM barrel protein [Halobacillus locisalis]MBA2173500.1 TIM barrel protein [Halobacillus locisalis]
MQHQLGMSGSTILSDPDRFDHLFQQGCTHVEIGEFPSQAAFKLFLEKARRHNVTFGVHSPLIRGGSKYDLIENVAQPVGKARTEFEQEVHYLSTVGAEYVLVHFPYFKNSVSYPTKDVIEEGLDFLSRLQTDYGIPIVCEPKLGQHKSPCGIHYLHEFPKTLWKQYGLGICIDLGDYRMATEDEWKTYIEPLLPFTKVVHMHNVQLKQEGYIWTLMHPKAYGVFDMQPMIEYLASQQSVFFIFEHTPHTNPTSNEVAEAIQWIHKSLRNV